MRSRIWIPLYLINPFVLDPLVRLSHEVNALTKNSSIFSPLWVNFGTAFRHQMHKHVLMSRESSYRHLVDENYDLIMVVDNSQKLLFCNTAWMDTMRYNKEEIKAMQFGDILSKDSGVSIYSRYAFKHYGSSDFSRHEINFTLTSKFGESIYLEGIGVTYATEEYKAIEFVVKNITTQVLTEKRIQNLARFPMENPNPVLRLSFKNKPSFITMLEKKSLTSCNKMDVPEKMSFFPIIQGCIEKGFFVKDVAIGNQIFHSPP